ncbi:MAG: hypothetical protein OEV33_07495 [Armatimonadota bacterium]|nr:hypothetical protein [Armatimonadota bacterium]
MTDTTPARRRSSPLFTIVVLVLIAALAVEAYLYFRPGAKQPPPEAAAAIARGASQKVETFGDSSAPIKVKLYAPLTLDWHQKTIRLLRAYNDDHPGRIHVTLMPKGLKECDEEMNYSCAMLFINGENEFTLPDGREVTLEKRPNESYSTYNSEDVITLLDQLSNNP